MGIDAYLGDCHKRIKAEMGQNLHRPRYGKDFGHDTRSKEKTWDVIQISTHLSEAIS